MNEETTRVVEGKPVYDEYLPGPIQVLIEWILLLISTLSTYFKRKEG